MGWFFVYIFIYNGKNIKISKKTEKFLKKPIDKCRKSVIIIVTVIDIDQK